MLKLWKLWSVVKPYLIPIGGFILLLLKFVSQFLDQKDRVNKGNSIPKGRIAEVNEVDSTGNKQVPQERGHVTSDKPQGVEPEKVTKVTGKGTLKPDPKNDTTTGLLSDLEK